MKKAILMPIILPFLVLTLSACTPKKVDFTPVSDSSVSPAVTEVGTIDAVTNKATGTASEPNITDSGDDGLVRNCGSDKTCLMSSFTKCQPAEFKTKANGGDYIFSVVGPAGTNCYYQGGFYKDGVLINSGMSCSLPKSLISVDILNHFLGLDGAADQGDLRAQQDNLRSQYCTLI
ncbi:MAG: hypothetical protein WC467_03075 [Patescibacteria group bacterium]